MHAEEGEPPGRTGTQSAGRGQQDVTSLQRVVAADVHEPDPVSRSARRRRGRRERGPIDVVLVAVDSFGRETIEQHDVAQGGRGHEDLVDTGERRGQPGGPIAPPRRGAGARTRAVGGVEWAGLKLRVDEEEAGAPPPEVVHRHDGRDAAARSLGEKVGP
jgi:hypothetical protein